jgi:hypothetical protein
MPMKAAFAQYLKDKPTVKAIFVGTRRTDPHGQLLTHFDVTDHGWPPFMRVHPVIDWHYAEIWTVSNVIMHAKDSRTDTEDSLFATYRFPIASYTILDIHHLAGLQIHIRILY